MNDDMRSPLAQRPDYLVCTCMGVMYSEIVEAIQGGADNFAALKDQLMVGTGCNSCVAEVHDILREETGRN